ncbi:unnamed protein product [Caenorhabditis auriculariae]|uniref:Uncharacterized protein n=1 Tax=Caenorhabditis auriculariae TaxID=2777116 RepID=A0A8S1HKK3_9PELO|nr:unnamed protein product [Caenorhabditis auriculariae]
MDGEHFEEEETKKEASWDGVTNNARFSPSEACSSTSCALRRHLLLLPPPSGLSAALRLPPCCFHAIS